MGELDCVIAEKVSKFRYDALIEPLACPPLPH